MASKVFENIDLVRAIYGFGPEHRQLWSQVVLRKTIHDIMDEFCNSPYYTRKASAFIDFLKEYYSLKERREIVGRLRLCHCCSRHSHYKDLPVKPVDPVPESKRVDTCHCNCRHTYRMLRRKRVDV